MSWKEISENLPVSLIIEFKYFRASFAVNRKAHPPFIKMVGGWCTGCGREIDASLVAQTAKNLPALQETQVRIWVGKIPWRRAWQPTPVLLPGESHGQRSLVGCSPGGRKESDRLGDEHTLT